MSLLAFAEVNKVPLQFPRVKIAMIMRSYRKPPSKGWCPLPEAAWTSSDKIANISKLEAILGYFHVT